MIKIEFPADRTDIAAAIGRALLEIGGVALNHSVRERVGDIEVETVTTTQPVTGAEEQLVLQNDTSPEPLTIKATGVELDDAGNLPQIDGKGVAFHAAFCGISAKPFYETGKTSGQWKKRRGVDQAAYDAWYAEQLPTQTAADPAPVDTAGAFPTTDTPPTEPEHTHAPTTCGEYMGWVSAKQAAELLTQDDVNAAYATVGLQGVADLFPPNSDQVVADRVLQLHRELVSKAGA
jgi:hypothetical protein